MYGNRKTIDSSCAFCKSLLIFDINLSKIILRSAAVNAPDLFCFGRMIEVENISVHFGSLLLFEHLFLHVNRGESVCVCGDSGSGKTSLLKAIMGFVPVSEGVVRVDGMELSVHNADLVRRRIAWIPQELALPAEWVSDMARMPFELKANREVGFSTGCLFENFALLGLEKELYHKRVHEVSGGQRQRIMLAVAGLLNKSVLIVDEPTSALDPSSCDRVTSFFKSLCAKGMTILAVSHDKRFATGCDRIFYL